MNCQQSSIRLVRIFLCNLVLKSLKTFTELQKLSVLKKRGGDSIKNFSGLCTSDKKPSALKPSQYPVGPDSYK